MVKEIRDHWDMFVTIGQEMHTSSGTDMPDEDTMAVIKMAFYAGAAAMFEIVHNLAGAQSEEEIENGIGVLENELYSHISELKSGQKTH